MKKLLLIVFLAAAAIPFQNCGTKEPPVGIDTTDTTTVPPKPQPVNTFKINGVETWTLTWDSSNMTGKYTPNDNLSTIDITGYTSKGELCVIKLIFPGNAPGTFKHSKDKEVDITIQTGTGTKYKQYVFSTQPNKEMTISVSKFDPIGGRIKGNFSGDLQESQNITTKTISGGAFEVKAE